MPISIAINKSILSQLNMEILHRICKIIKTAISLTNIGHALYDNDRFKMTCLVD
jgi:hypothetical protein